MHIYVLGVLIMPFFQQLFLNLSTFLRGSHGRDYKAVGFITIPMQSMPITTKVVNSTDEVYCIQHYMIKFVSDFCRSVLFSPGTPVSSTNKTDHHDIILLKVALNTITMELFPEYCIFCFSLKIIQYNQSEYHGLMIVHPITV